MKTLASVVGKIVLSLILSVIVLSIIIAIYTIVAVASGEDANDISTKLQTNIWIQYSQIILFIVSSLAMYSWFERKKGWSLGLKQRNASQYTVQGLITGIILISLSAVLIWILGGISWQATSWNQALLLSLLKGILLFIGVSISEEIFARGYVQGLLRFHYGSTVAIMVSSIIFALLHSFNSAMYESPIPIINLFLAGVIMALARELTGGLWWPIGLHVTWNFFQGYVYGFHVSGTDPVLSVLQTSDNGPTWLSGAQFGAEGSIIASLMLVIGTIGVYYFYKERNAKLPHTHSS